MSVPKDLIGVSTKIFERSAVERWPMDEIRVMFFCFGSIDAGGRIQPSIDRIATELKLTAPRVLVAMESLQKRGVVHAERHSLGFTNYLVNEEAAYYAGQGIKGNQR